jgi:hypothetical protein
MPRMLSFRASIGPVALLPCLHILTPPMGGLSSTSLRTRLRSLHPRKFS